MGHFRRMINVLGLAAALVLAGCGSAPSPSPATYDFGLSIILLTDAADFSDATNCTGTGEFADLHSGADVLFSDAAGAIVGTATLSKGEAGDDPTSCRLEARVEGLPGLPSYTVKVGQLEYQDLFDFAEVADSGHTTLLLSRTD